MLLQNVYLPALEINDRNWLAMCTLLCCLLQLGELTY